jgi:hypothetical protein
VVPGWPEGMRNHHALAGRLLAREYDYVRYATEPRLPCRVEVTGFPATSPSGPGMHVPAHTAQASHQGSQVLCSRVRSAMAAGLRRLQSA